MLQLQRLSSKWKDSVAIVSVSLDRQVEAARQYVRQNNITLDSYTNPKGPGFVSLGLRFIPTTVFLDKDGRIVEMQVGALKDEQVERILERLVK